MANVVLVIDDLKVVGDVVIDFVEVNVVLADLVVEDEFEGSCFSVVMLENIVTNDLYV